MRADSDECLAVFQKHVSMQKEHEPAGRLALCGRRAGSREERL